MTTFNSPLTFQIFHTFRLLPFTPFALFTPFKLFPPIFRRPADPTIIERSEILPRRIQTFQTFFLPFTFRTFQTFLPCLPSSRACRGTYLNSIRPADPSIIEPSEIRPRRIPTFRTFLTFPTFHTSLPFRTFHTFQTFQTSFFWIKHNDY
jgi:hypothetical protein